MDSSLIEKELGLPPGFLDTKCTNEDILNIYQHIVYSKELASHLRLKDSQIHAVEHDARSEQEKSLMLLKTWKQTFSIFAKHRKLIDALLKINKSDTACEVCKALYPNYRESPQLTQHCQQPPLGTDVTGSYQSGPRTANPVQEQTPDAPGGQPASMSCPPPDVQAQPMTMQSPPTSVQTPQTTHHCHQSPLDINATTGSLQSGPPTGFAVQASQDASMPSLLPGVQGQPATMPPTNVQTQPVSIQGQSTNGLNQQAQPVNMTGQFAVTQNQPGSVMEQAVSLNRPPYMTGQLAMLNQSPGQPTVAQNQAADVFGQALIVQAQAMVFSGQSVVMQNLPVNAQGQGQRSSTVQEVSEGVQDMEVGGQPSNRVDIDGSGHRVDADNSGEEESAVEGDGFFRNKKRIQLTSKGQKKKAADPPSTTSRSVSVDDDNYKMSATPRGIGIVINNKSFDSRSKLSNRTGTDIDAKKLVDLFKWLEFETRRFDDQTAEQIKTKLEEVAKDCDKHGNYDCVMVAILSHGGDNGVLWGSDGQEVMVKSLTRYFDGNYCKSLVNKPKVFILQACRGGKKDRIVETTDSAADVQPDSLLPTGVDHVVECDYRKSLPSENGFILAFSTTPGYLSWRSTDTGSWYIDVLEEQMRKLAGKKHFVDILTKVNRKLSESEEYVTESHKQMSSYESRLTRSLFFFSPPPQS